MAPDDKHDLISGTCSHLPWSLIHLESELMAARAWMNVFGSLPEGQGMTIVAFWAGYEFTLYDLEPRGGGIQRFIGMWPRQSVLWLHTLINRTGRTDVSRPGMN
ncbi:hypothetical protein NEK76_004704, partial [Escherichia coli]